MERMSSQSLVVWLITMRVTPLFFSFPEFDAPAREDSWIAILLAVIPVTLALWVIVSVSRLFPGAPLSEAIEARAGKLVGSIVNLFLAGYFLLEAAMSLWELDEVLVTTVLVRTPPVAVSAAMAIVVTAAVRQGIEPIARTAIVLAAGGILGGGLLSLLLLPDVRLDRLLPVFPIDPGRILSSVIYHASLSDLLIVAAFLLPYTAVRPGELRLLYSTPAIAHGIIAAAMLLVIAVLSFPVADSLNFEYLSLIREVTLGRFLERFDPLVLTAWTVLAYLRVSAFMLCALISLSTVLGLRDYRPLSIPMGIILVTLSLVVFDTFAAREFYVTGGGLVLNLLVCYFLPLMLWLFFRATKGPGRPAAANPSASASAPRDGGDPLGESAAE